MRKMKVFICNLGTESLLIAAPSQRVAAEAFSMSLHAFRQYATETGDQDRRELALAHPLVLFKRSNRSHGDAWSVAS